MTTSIYYEDASKLLQFDPMSVVVNLASNRQPVEPLQTFTGKLQHYVELAKAVPVTKTTTRPVDASMAQTAEEVDPDALLLFDPGAVVLRQIGELHILNRLAKFACELQHFVNLAVRHAELETANTNSEEPSQEPVTAESHLPTENLNRAAEDVGADIQETEDTIEGVRVPEDGTANNHSGAVPDPVQSKAPCMEPTPARVESHSQQEDPFAQENDIILGAEEITFLPDPTCPVEFGTASRGLDETSQFVNQVTPNENAAQCQQSASFHQPLTDTTNDTEKPRKNQRIQNRSSTQIPLHVRHPQWLWHHYPHPGAAFANRSNAPQPVQRNAQNEALLAGPSNALISNSSIANLNNKRDNEVSPDQPNSKKRRSSKKAKKEEDEEEKPPLPEAPKVDAPAGYKGTLAESLLQRSVGLTRTVLNMHRTELGLHASFGVPVVSSMNGQVSHMTFNSAWNELPFSKDQTLKFRLGEGKVRLSSVTPLDPANNPESTPVPIFWAQSQKKAGGALCYYVGHFRCINFDTTQKVMLKGKRRQALLEFQLSEFKVDFDEKLRNIAYPEAAPAVHSEGTILQDRANQHREVDLPMLHHSIMA